MMGQCRAAAEDDPQATACRFRLRSPLSFIVAYIQMVLYPGGWSYCSVSSCVDAVAWLMRVSEGALEMRAVKGCVYLLAFPGR